MTIPEAFDQLVDSEDFKAKAKTDAKYRVYLGRFKKGILGIGAMVEILVQNGYEVKANRARKQR